MAARENWAERLNRWLLPYLGPPPLGPYNEPTAPDPATRPCPLCGRVMSGHVIERSEGNVATRLHCPSPAQD